MTQEQIEILNYKIDTDKLYKEFLKNQRELAKLHLTNISQTLLHYTSTNH